MSAQPTPSQLADIATEHARAKYPGAHIFAIVEHDSRMDLRWARNTLTTNGVRAAVTATIVGFQPVQGGVGVVSASVSGPDAGAMRELVDQVLRAATTAPPAEDQFELVANLESGAWTDAAAQVDIAGISDLTQSLGEVFRSAASWGIEHFGYAEQGVETTYLASTTGVRRAFAQPSGRVEMTAKSHERTRSAWQGFAGDDIAGANIADLDARLREGLAWQATRLDIQPGRHRAVLTSGAVADLLCEFWWTATARDAAEGRSVFAGAKGPRLGERLTARNLTIASNPHDARFPNAPFVSAASSNSHGSVFDNGLEIEPHTWLDQGVLANLIAPRAIARDLGLPAVNSADCLAISDEDGTGSLTDLAARAGDGLLVTCLWYNRVVDAQSLLITGLTRDGVYVIRGGEIVGCTSNFRFNDSPVGMLSRITDAGAAERTLPREMGDYVHRIAAPPMTIDDFNFSTVSDAL